MDTELEQYCFHVEHRKRDKHFNADVLTKQPHHFELMEKQKTQEASEVGGFTFLADPKDFEALKDVEPEENGETATEEKNKNRIISVNLKFILITLTKCSGSPK